MARKQVERSPVDPGIFIITYTAEHNHPIPIHRQKVAGGPEVGTELPEAPCTATSSCSPSAQKDDDVGTEDIVSEEETEEEMKGAGNGTAFGAVLSDHFGSGFSSPWLTSSAAAV